MTFGTSSLDIMLLVWDKSYLNVFLCNNYSAVLSITYYKSSDKTIVWNYNKTLILIPDISK
jgi:hypothetical protein